jgi:uncharacterized membrane protein
VASFVIGRMPKAEPQNPFSNPPCLRLGLKKTGVLINGAVGHKHRAFNQVSVFFADELNHCYLVAPQVKAMLEENYLRHAVSYISNSVTGWCHIHLAQSTHTDGWLTAALLSTPLYRLGYLRGIYDMQVRGRRGSPLCATRDGRVMLSRSLTQRH